MVTCPRYKLVSQSLAEGKDLSVDLVRSLLKATAQQYTTYSTIFDLTNGEVYVHHRSEFDRTVKINLKEELGKAERAVKIASLFTPEGELRRWAGMDAYVREAMQKWEVPGLAIAVVKDGEIVLARGYGVCEIGKDRKVTRGHRLPDCLLREVVHGRCRGHAGRGREIALGRSGRKTSAGFRAFRSLPDGARHAARSVVSSHGLAAGRLAGGRSGF